MNYINSYYKLLKSKADADIMNIPISAIGLSSKTKELLYLQSKYIKGQIIPQFTTIGDLISFGKESLQTAFFSHNKRFHEVNEAITDIEECLAKMGLKLKGSDFTVGDVRVEKLELIRNAKNVINKLKGNIKTLDDLVAFGAIKLSKYIHQNKLATIYEISQELEKYGLKLEYSTYSINKERFFPLYDYLQFLSPERQKKILKIKQANIRTAYNSKSNIDLKSLTYDELLDTSIEELPVSSSIKESFDINDISTIDDLINTNSNLLKHYLSDDQFKTLIKVLGTYNLSFKDYEELPNKGKRYVRLLPTAPQKRNIKTLPEDEQQKFLNIKIKDFGFSSYLTEIFENQTQIQTIGDLIKRDKCSVVELIGHPTLINSIQKVLLDYGLDFTETYKKHNNTKYFDAKTIKENNIPEELSEEQKQAYKSMPLLRAGFTPSLISAIHSTGIKAETIQDLLSHVRSEFTGKGMSDAQFLATQKILGLYGHKIGIDKTKGRYKTDEPVKVLKPEEMQELKSKSIETLNLYPSLVQTLKNNNISTIGDLVFNSKAEIKNMVNGNIYAYKAIKESLSSIGLKLINVDEKKKALKEVNGSAIYQMRQEEHRKRAILYLAHRNSNVKPRNINLFNNDFNKQI